MKWPELRGRITPTSVDRKKKKIREGLAKSKKPFPGSVFVGAQAIRKRKKQLDAALTYE